MFWGAAGYRADVGQNLGIVPTAATHANNNKSPPHLDVDTVPARGAGGDLGQQLIELRRSRRGLVCLAQPVAQHVGLPRAAQGLQRGNARRQAHRLQVLLRGRHLQQQFARLRSMARAAGKVSRNAGKADSSTGSRRARIRLRV